MKVLGSSFLMFLFLISCGRNTLVVESEMGGTSSISSGTLKIKISSALVGPSDAVYVVQGERTFSGDSQDVGNHSFDVFVDEEILMFSKLKFEIEKVGDKNDCAVVYFRPYQYKKSVAPKFKPTPTSEVLNCSGFALVPEPPPDPLPAPVPIPVPPGCFGGPAKDIVPNFPLFSSLFTTENKIEKEAKFTNEENNVDPYIGNRYYANNMEEVERGTAQDGLYIASSMRDYSAYCRDAFGNKLLEVQINISDFDGEDPNPDTDQYCTWLSADCGLD
jgi:hypothetical protein